MPNLKGGILYSQCPFIDTRHLACQVGDASAGFIFIKFIGNFFIKHAAEEEGRPCASKPVSPSCTQASVERRAAGARRSVSPSPPPMGRVAPDEVDGRDKDNGPGGAAAPKGTTMML